ncbi:acetyltransferase [Tsukamurella pulmonis]|uniref:Protein N-acetyltransferase, RimJ/RimL family n=1 Tax=Tsukamurella pulmonis TaxID=47312 RepID=A0A1H1DC52_9ACTN|nr:GNAT family N-acetyltransferase [Tsukamurella pulmonis]KXO92391.1 acetyltransferase [Tsukamurella pulmonis]SDQ74091.1 Protein N-acetyltransferase, RimJ/RimL family [Tsukamurella pulmonis]SUP22210.1 Putative ribosomal N-acetyltransferase YdaF [Tsukamurella pulmonis]
MDPVELRTPHLILRRPNGGDAPAIAEACADPGIQRYVPVPSPYTEGDAREFVATAVREWEADESYAFVALAGADLVGVSQLTRKEAGLVELGYWAAPGNRRCGYTLEAARRVCQWGFDILGIHRIDWWAVVGNHGSRAVAESIGFEVEGVLRQRAMLRGVPQDWWIGGLLTRPD